MKRKFKWLRVIVCILLCVCMLIPEIAAACTSCNYKTVYSYENGTHHSYLAKCTVCGTTKTGWGYSGWSTHSFSSGRCTDCGYTCSHSFSDGTCSKCSYTCTHSSTKKIYSYENVGAGYHQHSYVTSCNTCGKTITGYGYSGWGKCTYPTSGAVTCGLCGHTCGHNLKTVYNQKTDEKHAKTVSCSYGCAYGGTSMEVHSFIGDVCEHCGYTRVSSCSHTYTYSNHGNFTYNGISYTHKGTCSKCQHISYASKITNCSTCNPSLVTASVKMSVSGDMEVTSLPASYTVSATGTNCNVTSIYWLDSSGTKYTVKTGSSSSLSYTFTASAESAFPHSRVYYCTTSASGVTGTVSVNFTFAKYAAAGIKWSKDGSTLRTISLNGTVIKDGLSIRLSDYQGATASIPEAYRSAIESAIGTVKQGVTYSLTCYGNAFSYYSADGMAITNKLGSYYLYNQLDSMLSSQSWSNETKNAISSYRVMSAVLETSKPVSVTAKWVEIDASGKTVGTIGTKTLYSTSVVYPSKNLAVSVSYGSGPATLSNYEYVSTAWSGSSSGTSEERTYAESYTVNSSPLTVTFYAKKKVVTGDITVNVVDANTGAAISGASITGGGTGTTSSAGSVKFTGLTLGSYSFTASATGYNSGSGSATISESQTSATVTIKLTPIPTTGSITVKVVDANTGAAISGASITGGGTGTTSSSGTVTFNNVAFGTYTYTATKSGYYSGSGSGTISLSAQSTTVTIKLSPIPTTGNITVIVKNSQTQSSISGASVSGASRSGTTNTSGSVSFSSVPFGMYTFTASATGYYSNSGSATISLSSQSATITIYLDPIPTTGTITVKVVDANTGAAISGANITGGKSGTTSSAGTVSFADVPFGTYSFTASKSGYLSNSGSATISLSAQSTTVTIKLTPVGSVTVYVRDKVTNTLISGASISGSGSGTTNSSGSVSFGSLQIGTYTYSATKSGYISGSGSASVTKAGDSLSVTIYLTPIGSVTVYVRDKATNALISGASITGSGSGTTNSSGSVSFGSLQIGTYSYTASKSGYIGASGSASITKAGDNLTVTIYLTPIGSVTVYVRDKATNALIAGASITGSGTGTTSSSGSVSFGSLQIGTYSYTASKSGYIGASGSASITKAGDNLTITIYLTPIGSITVYVRDKTTNVLISGASITGYGSGTTNSAGTVSFGSLQIGTYSYTASKSGYLSGSGSASITKAGDSLSVTIYLTPIGSITVYVRDKATNALISGASITGSGSGTSNSSGAISFGNLQIGTYSYTASKSGYLSGSVSASVTKAGDSLSVTIYLTPVGSITVYVRDKATNALISGASITGSGSGTTNSAGAVSFGSLQIGTYSYTASKSGYLSGSGSASVTKAGDSLSVTIYLTPIGSITVYVRDGNTNSLISGATVSGAGTSGTTNSSGAVRFSNLQINTYSFTASASGYISGTGSASVTKAGDSISVTIYLTPIGSITVYVRDQVTNALISGATVSGAGTSGTTNSSGAVRFNNLQINTYSFTASATGYRNGTVSASVTKAGDAITATIYLTPIGSITVYARDKDTNALLSGVTIAGAGTSGTTNSSGAVRFSNLTMGTYSFTASKHGYTSGTGTATLTYAGQATSITIYLENRTADVSITANPINGTVYRGSQIMVAATVHNDSVLSFKNTNPLSVTLTARKDGSTVISTQTKTVICPANESNLVWFPVDIPSSGYSAGNVQFTFTVSVPSGYVDPDTSNNTSSKTVTASVLPQRQVPDPDFQLEAPSSFTYSKYQNKTANTRTWSVWEWNGGFVKRTYDASLTTKAALSPDTTAGWSKYNSTNQLWTTRSGYGFNTAVTVSLSGVPTDMFAGHAKVNAYYPEFGYTSAQDKSSMLRMESENTGGYTAEFTFASNTDTISKNKMHVTPVWFPDGAYSVKYEVYDVWTPSGVLTASTYAIINIEGSMYDDYYTQRN